MKTIKIITILFFVSLFSSQVYAWDFEFREEISVCPTFYTPYINESTTGGRSFTISYEIDNANCDGGYSFYTWFYAVDPTNGHSYYLGFDEEVCETQTGYTFNFPENVPNIYSKSMILRAHTRKYRYDLLLIPIQEQYNDAYFVLNAPNATTIEGWSILTGGQITPEQTNYSQHYLGENCQISPGTFATTRYKVEWTITGNFANVEPQVIDNRSIGWEYGTAGTSIVCQYYRAYANKINNQTIKFWTYTYEANVVNHVLFRPVHPSEAVVVYRLLQVPTTQYLSVAGPSDNTLYIGESMTIANNATGFIDNYVWTKKYCGTYIPCNIIPQGLLYTQQNNLFKIRNANYTGVVCDGFCGHDDSGSEDAVGNDAEETISLKLETQACNPIGCTQVQYYPPVTNPDTRIRFGIGMRQGGISGCPNIVTFKDGITDYENNLLHRNEAISFGSDIDDYLVIKNDITETDSTVSFYIKETDDKNNFFDQIKMFAYDVPFGCKIVMSENNQFYLFDTTIIASSSEAILNQESDITELIQYNPSLVPDNPLTGDAQDNIDADFTINDMKNLASDFYNVFEDSINNGQIDSIALIIEMGRNPNSNGNVKMDAGSVTVTTETDVRYYTIFRRENMDYVVLPISTRGDKVSNINITMNRDYKIKFICITGILNITEGITELSLVDAFHSDPGLTELPSSLIASQDDSYLTLDSSNYIKLTYISLPYLVSADYTRKHILFVNGHYTGILGRPTSLASNDNTGKFELFENKPNPFNPTTTISFSLPKDSFVKIKVYNLLGQLIATLSNEVKKAGYNEVKFDGTNLASGIYFYHFDVEGIHRIKKMVLVK